VIALDTRPIAPGMSRSALNKWMTGASSDHPIAHQMRVDADGEWLNALAALLAELDQRDPVRLDGKRRDFRRLHDKDRWDDLCSELIFARWLVRTGIDFEFGAPGSPQPDLIVQDPHVGIEITRRRGDGSRALWRALWAGLHGVRPRPRLLITLSGHPLAVRQKVLADIVSEVITANEEGQSTVHAVLRPARDGHPAITATIDLHRGISVVPTARYADSASLLSVTLLDIEDVISAVLEDEQKSRQGAALPSIVVVDVSDLPDAVWMRPNSMWGPRLADLQSGDQTFAGAALMMSSVTTSPPRFVLAVNPHACSDARMGVERLGHRLGLANLPS